MHAVGRQTIGGAALLNGSRGRCAAGVICMNNMVSAAYARPTGVRAGQVPVVAAAAAAVVAPVPAAVCCHTPRRRHRRHKSFQGKITSFKRL